MQDSNNTPNQNGSFAVPVPPTPQPVASTQPQVKSVVGRRVVAAIIDLIIASIIFFVLGLLTGVRQDQVHTTKRVYATIVGPRNGQVVHEWENENITTSRVSLVGIRSLICYLIVFTYYWLPEFLIGATVGKLAMAIRVRKSDGTKISIAQALIRNLLRVVDAFPFFIPYLLGFIVILTTPHKQRVGDLAAKTFVIGA